MVTLKASKAGDTILGCLFPLSPCGPRVADPQTFQGNKIAAKAAPDRTTRRASPRAGKTPNSAKKQH
jgi:hypothetical protein